MTNPSLDSSQREAVRCKPGPCEIIAGPGSGKTTVLIEHILYLIQSCGISPDHILVLTFGRLAAKEMRERFIKRLGTANPGVTFGTFHSVFYQIVQTYSDQPVRLIGDALRIKLLKDLLTDCIEDPSLRPELNQWETLIASCRSTPDLPSSPYVAEAASQYDLFLHGHGYLDYDDLIRSCLHILESRIDIRERCRALYSCILVDEFQDVDRQQYDALKLLCGKNGFYCVGDDDQSIYGFRGSSPDIMKQFLKDYPEAKQVFLRQNYRCDRKILTASLKVIEENKNRIHKKLIADSRRKGIFEILGLPDERAQFRYLAEQIRDLSPWEQKKTAIIFRTNAHAESFSRFLTGESISHTGKFQGNPRVYEHITEDLRAYNRLAESLVAGNPFDREDLLRVMNKPERGLRRFYDRSEVIFPSTILHQSIDHPSQKTRWHHFLADLKHLSSLPVYYGLRYLLDTMEYEKYTREAFSRQSEQETAGQFLHFLKKESKSTPTWKFLIDHSVDFARDRQNSAANDSSSGVHILTMHASKGLEFDRVYIPCLNEGIIPVRNCHLQKEIEEERRLFYVAMTRAKHELFLLYAEGSNKNSRRPSRFLEVLGIHPYSQ